MRKAATKKSVTTTEDVVQQRLSALEPKQQFLSAAMNMGWQLGGAVLIPVFIGIKLDAKFKTSPSLTLAAFVIACIGAVSIVNKTVKQVNQDQAEDELTRNSKKENNE